MLQNELKNDVARFTTHVQTCEQPDLLQDRFDVGGKTRNIAIQPRFAAMLQDKLHVFCCPFFRTLSNRDDNGKKKTIGFMSQTTFLHVRHAF